MTGNDPYTPTKRSLFIYTLAIALALLLLVGGGVIAIRYVGRAIDSNREALRRLNRIEHPTPRQFRTQLKNGIKLCLRDPECRRLFPEIRRDRRGRAVVRPAPRRTRRTSTPGTGPGSPTNVVRGHGSVGHSQRSPSPKPTSSSRRPPARTPARGSPAPAPAPSPPPSAPPAPPVVSVTTPLPVQVCVDRLAAVNC